MGFTIGHPFYNGAEKGWFKSDQVPWNLGKHTIKKCKVCGKEFSTNRGTLTRPHQKYCSLKCSAKNQTGRNYPKCPFCGVDIGYKSKICRKCCRDDRHGRWRGDDAGYVAIHTWMRLRLGRPVECVYCGKTKSESVLQWASISHKAKRDLGDYISLCIPCHKKYDLEGVTP